MSLELFIFLLTGWTLVMMSIGLMLEIWCWVTE